MHSALYPWAPGSQSRRPGAPRVPVSGRRSASGAELRPQACSRDAIATAGVFSRLCRRCYGMGDATNEDSSLHSLTDSTEGWLRWQGCCLPGGRSSQWQTDSSPRTRSGSHMDCARGWGSEHRRIGVFGRLFPGRQHPILPTGKFLCLCPSWTCTLDVYRVCDPFSALGPRPFKCMLCVCAFLPSSGRFWS